MSSSEPTTSSILRFDPSRLTRISADSSSVISSVSVPGSWPIHSAVIVTVFVPSTKASSTPLMLKTAESFPSRMVTVGGTLASSGLSLNRLTIKSPVVPGLRITLALAKPPFSDISSSVMVRVRIRTGGTYVSMVSSSTVWSVPLLPARSSATMETSYMPSVSEGEIVSSASSQVPSP